MKFDSQLYWSHGAENVDLIFRLISFVRGVKQISIKVEFEIVSSGVILIDEGKKKVPLCRSKELIGSSSLETINQILV